MNSGSHIGAASIFPTEPLPQRPDDLLGMSQPPALCHRALDSAPSPPLPQEPCFSSLSIYSLNTHAQWLNFTQSPSAVLASHWACSWPTPPHLMTKGSSFKAPHMEMGFSGNAVTNACTPTPPTPRWQSSSPPRQGTHSLTHLPRPHPSSATQHKCHGNKPPPLLSIL